MIASRAATIVRLYQQDREHLPCVVRQVCSHVKRWMRRETFGKTVFGPNPASRKILRFENRRAEGADEARRLVVADGIQLLERQRRWIVAQERL